MKITESKFLARHRIVIVLFIKLNYLQLVFAYFELSLIKAKAILS